MVSEVGGYDPLFVIDSRAEPQASAGHGAVVYKDAYGKFIYVHYVNPIYANPLDIYRDIGNGKVTFAHGGALSLIDTNEKKISLGPNAYNGALVVAVPSASPGSAYTIAARAQNADAGGVDTGEHILLGVGALSANRWYTITGQAFSGKLPIDIYENGNYITTARAGKASSPLSVMEDQRLVNTLYVENPQIPAPLSSVYSRENIRLLSATAGRAGISAMYNLGNQLALAGDIFELFGAAYIYANGEISQIEKTAAGVITGYSATARAPGLTYLVVTPNEAWFLSPWDNSLWTFTGGKTLDKKIRLNAKAAVTASAYNVAGNELALLLDSTNVLYIRDGISTLNTLDATGTGTKVLQATNQGVWLIVQGGAGNMARLQYNSTGGTAFPLTLQTTYQGLEQSAKHRVTRYIFTLYAAAKPATTVDLTFNAFDESRQFTPYTETKTVTWDANGYARIQLVPQTSECLASSIKLYTTSHLAILDAYVYIIPSAEQVTLSS